MGTEKPDDEEKKTSSVDMDRGSQEPRESISNASTKQLSEDSGSEEKPGSNTLNNVSGGDIARNDAGNPSGRKGCLEVIRTARFQVYLSHFLSSWGDRMWMFAGGIFLMEVTPGSLRLAAVYGAAVSLTIILFGAPIGRLVDRSSRLRMAQVSLCIQNLMVCVCAALLVLLTTQRSWFEAWDGWALIATEAAVIIAACVAQIGTLGSKLTIEKDWILVICGQDKTRLATMNSVLRSLDLSTEVLAPVIVGTIMTSVGNAAGGIAIAVWNIGSLIVEYGLLHYLFYSNKDLQKPKVVKESKQTDEDGPAAAHIGNGSKWHALKMRLVSAWEAWVAYMKSPIRDAGLGLALLFMTVISFDNYSRGFIFESGVSETILGILTALGSIFGIIGASLYPRLRKKVGITKTGLIGFGAETLCVMFCAASVFAPGSPFDASAFSRGNERNEQPMGEVTQSSTIVYETVSLPDMTNTSLSIYAENTTEDNAHVENDFTSVILLLTGIITSRTGLWLADLSVTQILQERVEEHQRGAINGVQSSLNQCLDLLRSILIIILPTRETYGFLILLSVLFIAIGWLLFGIYSRKEMSRATTEFRPSEERQVEESV